MKKIFLFIGILFALNVTAQSQYEKGMVKAFDLWGQGKVTEAANLFERIAKAEPENWIPSYYVGYINIMTSFGIKDEATLNAKLDKAGEYLDNALLLSPKNAEILIIQALKNTSYIAFDGQKYGMTMSGRNTAIFEKAIKLAPNNPRVILQKAEWDMGAARFFNQSTEPFCKDIERALELFKKAGEPTEKFAPDWGKDRAEAALKNCGK
jgi:tetratricopeptide (TPR) repeat protein